MLNSLNKAYAASNLWGLLAFGFAYPSAEQFALISAGTFHRDILDYANECLSTKDITVTEFVDGLDLADGNLASMEADYIASFQTNAPKPSASLFESHYNRNPGKPAILLELKAFFEKFGLDVARGSGDLEDSLTAQLEMMHFLSARQTHNRSVGKEDRPYVLAQHDFLSRHLAVWIPAFREDVEKKSQSSFYCALARITEQFVAHEICRLRNVLHPTPSADIAQA